MGLREAALGARAAQVVEEVMAEQRVRRQRWERDSHTLTEHFRRTFRRDPDSVDPEESTATADGITLRLRCQFGAGAPWWEREWVCPACGMADHWVVTSLEELGRALEEEQRAMEEHICRPPAEGHAAAPGEANIRGVYTEDVERESVADVAALRGKRVYLAVSREMVPSRDAFVPTISIIAVCSTKDEARRRIADAPHLAGSRNWFPIQVWEIDGKRVS
jgi:hypothetical protein